jgi:hypothetical protein
MAYWWIDRTLPGVVASAVWMPIWTAALWLSHRKLRRHVDQVTKQQNAHIERLTASQTAELSGQRKQGEGADGPV